MRAEGIPYFESRAVCVVSCVVYVYGLTDDGLRGCYWVRLCYIIVFGVEWLVWTR